MSYILNALKKAEQDRLRESPKDLEDFASARWDPYQQPSSSNRLNYILIIIFMLVLSLGLMAYRGVFSPSPQTANNPVDKPAAPLLGEIKSSEVAQVSIPQPAVQTTPLAVPELAVSGHMYFSEGSSSNRLFANGKSYKETDKIAEGWVLVAIGLEGIKIRSGERLEFLPYP